MTEQQLRWIVREEYERITALVEAGPSRKFTKAAEALYNAELKQQQLRKKFVAEKDPDKKEALKQDLIKLHKQVQQVQSAFNAILRNEPVDVDEQKKGLWHNIHAKRKRGEKPAKKGSKAYKKAEKAIKDLQDGVISIVDIKEDTTARSKPSYFKGLSKDDKKERERVIARRKKMDDDDPDAYKKFRSDAGVKTKPSQHTKKYKQMFGEVSSAVEKALKKKAKKTGMPYGVLKQVFIRGMAAWKTGHKPGASQQQWGYARVNSFVTKSKGTWGGADKDLAKKVRGKKK